MALDNNETIFDLSDFFDFEGISLKKAQKTEEILEYYDTNTTIYKDKAYCGLTKEEFYILAEFLESKDCIILRKGNTGVIVITRVTERGKIIYRNKILSKLAELKNNSDVNDSAKKLTNKTIQDNSNKFRSMTKIYFSYAWGDAKEQGESREKIVDDLYNELLKEGYQVIRDKMDLGYRGFISDFMKEIGKGDIIVVATSDKYFHSPYCMFELYEIARNCKFDKNIFAEKSLPIMVEFIDFSKPVILDKYFEFWENEQAEWENLVKKRAGQLSQAQFDRFNKTKLIHQNFGQLTDWLIDMNTLNPTLLSKDNFAEIRKAISKNNQVVFQAKNMENEPENNQVQAKQSDKVKEILDRNKQQKIEGIQRKLNTLTEMLTETENELLYEKDIPLKMKYKQKIAEYKDEIEKLEKELKTINNS